MRYLIEFYYTKGDVYMEEKVKSITKKKNVLKITLVVIFALILTLIIAGMVTVTVLTSKMNKVNPTKEEMGITPEIEKEIQQIYKDKDKDKDEDAANYDSIINIGLFGIDAGSGELGRSDSIMILTIDPVHNKMKVASIMRDSYINIPGYGMDKINHAFAFGGSTLALNTINSNFNLNIDKFISTNFTNLPQIIDNLGGVDINITEEELPHLEDSGITSTGVHTLNGEQALAYSRIRYNAGDDFQRTSRHRTILGAIYKKVMTVPITQYPSLLSNFLPLVETNMSNTELLSLGNTVNKINGAELIEDRFPRDGFCVDAPIDGVYYLAFELEATKTQIQRFIYEN